MVHSAWSDLRICGRKKERECVNLDTRVCCLYELFNVCMCNICMCNVCMCNICMCNVCMCNVCMCNVCRCNVCMCNVCVRMLGRERE